MTDLFYFILFFLVVGGGVVRVSGKNRENWIHIQVGLKKGPEEAMGKNQVKTENFSLKEGKDRYLQK